MNLKQHIWILLMEKICPISEHKGIYWKQNQKLPVKVMLQLKTFFGYKVGYLHLVNGARAVFLLSNVLQMFLHLWDYICMNLGSEFSKVEVTYMLQFTSFWNQNVFDKYTEMSKLLAEQQDHLMLRTTWYWAILCLPRSVRKFIKISLQSFANWELHFTLFHYTALHVHITDD